METNKLEPKVSIIITVYNMEKYLSQCMESVLGQTYQNLDIVLVDDGSKDSSPALCDKYAEQDSRVQVLHKTNGGLISAWIAGGEISLGKYLIFLDSDDWVEKDMVTKLLSHARGDCKEMICSNYIIEKEKEKIPVKQKMAPGVYDRAKIETELFPELFGNESRMIHCSRCMKLISKELILDNMKYCNPNVTMGEDLSIIFPALLDTERLVIMGEGFFYHYRLINSSMAHQYDSKLYNKVELLSDTVKDCISTKVPSSEQDFWMAKWKEEYLFMLLLVVKNEMRGIWKGIIPRTRQLVKDAKEKDSYALLPMSKCGRKNKLLYHILKHPSVENIIMGKIVVDLFDTYSAIRNH